MALFGRSKSMVGLDIGTSAVKAVELTLKGDRLVISGIGTAEIQAAEQLPDAVRAALQAGGIRARRCASAVSGRSVIIRQVPMAPMSDGELRQALEYEADKYIPFDVNEVQIDAHRLVATADSAGQIKVLLVAVKKNLIDDHLAVLRSAGLSPSLVDVDVFALANAFELRNLALGIEDDAVRALIDIGASKTSLCIMRGNKGLFQREIYLAGNDMTDAVAKRFGEDTRDVERMKREPGGALESMQDAILSVVDDLASEIRLSFDYFDNQFEETVQEAFLSGGSGYFPGLDTLLGQALGLPVKIWDPTEGLEVAGTGSGKLHGANSDLTVALGLASRLRAA